MVPLHQESFPVVRKLKRKEAMGDVPIRKNIRDFQMMEEIVDAHWGLNSAVNCEPGPRAPNAGFSWVREEAQLGSGA